MKKPLPTFETAQDHYYTLAAVAFNLRTLRAQVQRAGASRAAAYLARAQKSLDGAVRHAKNVSARAERAAHA